MSEHSIFVRNALAFLNQRKFCHAFPYSPGPYGGKGTHDILVCFHGQFVSIELKIGQDKPSPHQRIFARRVKKALGTSEVFWTMAELKEYILSLEANQNILES